MWSSSTEYQSKTERPLLSSKMNKPITITTLALLLSGASVTLGLPQTTNAVSESRAILYPWSNHADCAAPATACKTDCTQAVKNLCQGNLGLGEQVDRNYVAETVGECTVTYIYQIGNTVPTAEQCYNTYAYINDAGKPGPDGCGGTFGGALGWDDKGNRTKDPIYAIQPKSGNQNCFKPPDKPEEKPLAVDELPDGTRIPMNEQCPSALSRRANGPCVGASVGFEIACDNGFKKRDGLTPRLALDAEPMLLDARADPPPDPCAKTQRLGLCPNTQKALLTFHRCPGTEGSELGGENVPATGEGAGPINF
ncbi:MAG: hypothetical protein LQ337_007178 [Flavoplaca oasis]|nr:MAG: hypothetical protein LQ337_007178 [Flavoplaca oasis]